MGLFSELFGAIARCLCSGIKEEPQYPPSGHASDIYVPPTVPHRPQVSQQPAPVYPPTQPQQPHPYQPPYSPPPQRQQQQHEQYSGRPEQEHKKHKKHHQQGQGQSGLHAQPQSHGPSPAPSSPPSRPWSPGRPVSTQVPASLLTTEFPSAPVLTLRMRVLLGPEPGQPAQRALRWAARARERGGR
ncbi:hypothetical protein BN946_scf184976.g4 [Trametes cinnabarina]|uniref:Uncharacterized protein n=1 Tax=Pycnoporus cinnabarinus TaxID=5643 RepID=A0A060S4Q4_PYCCI|nr:hypothetical protein BN946_scf184976.g4 [Trametes cinnabarina]